MVKLLTKNDVENVTFQCIYFQKNGQILDGIGTNPDIKIERNLDQIFWKEDYQLNKLKKLIREE